MFSCCEQPEFDSDSESDYGKLRVGVWNAASADEEYKKTADPATAAEFFWDVATDVVICPEGSDAVKAFQKAGYKTVYGTYGLRVFYYPHSLTKCGKEEKQVIEAGKGHDGKCVSITFTHADTNETILVVGVHAGHYGKSYNIIGNSYMEEKAQAAIQQLREIIKAESFDKVIVGGDFNELGVLMEKNRKKYQPIPHRCENVFGSIHVRATLETTGDTSDQIWVGGPNVDFHTCTDRKQDTFGSDHHGLTVWGV